MIHDLFAANDNDERNFWVGLDIELLPKSGAEAKSVGCRYFFTGVECVNGHVCPRYAAGGRCVVCIQDDVAKTRKGKRVGPNGAARAHLKRAIAALSGAKTYTPSRPCKHGHMLRWVGTNNCIECEAMRKDEYREARREARLLKVYGIASADYERMAAEQDSKCAICSEAVEDRALFHVDHCHETGAISGLLCSRCNQAIGLLRDDPRIIRLAADYVERHKFEVAA